MARASTLPLLSLCFWDHPISAGPYPLQRRADDARIPWVTIRLPKQRLDSTSATGFLSLHPSTQGADMHAPWMGGRLWRPVGTEALREHYR
jgi:hypothetical protein